MGPYYGPLPPLKGSEVWALSWGTMYKRHSWGPHTKGPCNYPSRSKLQLQGFRVWGHTHTQTQTQTLHTQLLRRKHTATTPNLGSCIIATVFFRGPTKGSWFRVRAQRPEPSTLNPKPQTLNPKPLNPKPNQGDIRLGCAASGPRCLQDALLPHACATTP